MPIAYISSENIISNAPAVKETSPTDVSTAMASADAILEANETIIVTEFSQELFDAIANAVER